MILWIIGGVILGILICSPGFISSLRARSEANQHVQEVQENEQNDPAFTQALQKTKQYLKYKKDIKLIYFVNVGICLLRGLTLIGLLFLPIFQIKAEVLGITLTKKNFSLFDNYPIIKENFIPKLGFWTMIAALAIAVFGFVICVSFDFGKVCYNGDTSALNIFKNVWFYNRMENKTTEHRWGGQKYDVPQYWEIVVGVLLLIIEIYAMRQLDEPNNFTLCNGVSGYLALPIISFFATIGLVVLSYRLQKNLKTKIKNEVVDLPKPEEESPQTTEASGAENQAEGTPQNAEEATPQSEERVTVNTTKNDEADLPKSEEVEPPKTEK